MSKIIICGLNGSGKTTLGKELAKKLNFIHKDIEDYYFNDSNNYKYEQSRSRDNVIKKLEKDFKKNENIIFTACTGDYSHLSDLYNLAIYINLDRETRLSRVKERSYKQFGDRILENGDLYEKELEFWNKVYNRDEAIIKDWFNGLKCPKLEIDGMKPIEENISIILDNLGIIEILQ